MNMNDLERYFHCYAIVCQLLAGRNRSYFCNTFFQLCDSGNCGQLWTPPTTRGTTKKPHPPKWTPSTTVRMSHLAQNNESVKATRPT